MFWFLPFALLLCVGRTTIRRTRILAFAGVATACHVLGLVTAYTFLGSSIQFFLLGWLLADIYVADWAEEPVGPSRRRHRLRGAGGTSGWARVRFDAV